MGADHKQQKNSQAEDGQQLPSNYPSATRIQTFRHRLPLPAEQRVRRVDLPLEDDSRWQTVPFRRCDDSATLLEVSVDDVQYADGGVQVVQVLEPSGGGGAPAGGAL